MNCFQAALQLEYLLATRLYVDSPTEQVFGQNSVVATAGMHEDALRGLVLPAAFVRPIDMESDTHTPAIKAQRFEITLVARHEGDRLGRHALVGGQRQSAGSSRGRGLLEIEEQLHQVLDQLTQANGIRVRGVVAGAAEAGNVEGTGYVAARRYQAELILTTDRFYPPPVNLASSVVGGGAVTLSWLNPADRFDRHALVATPSIPARGGLVMRVLAGSTAPSSVTAGSSVTIGGFVTSLAASPGAGTVSYSLFASYDEFGTGTLRYSDAATKTGIVVT